MELIIILILILLNGVFAMSEMALVASRKFKLENSEKKGNKGAKKALELSENPAKFLSTVQIGITLIGILLGVYSGEKLTKYVADFLAQYEAIQAFSGQIATVVIVVLITYVSIVLGELLPKRIGMTFPEPIISMFAQPMHILSIITSPFVWLLTTTNNLLLKILGIKKTSESKLSEEEIKAIVKESADGGEIQEIEQDIVARVFELGDTTVHSLYTHRRDIVYFDTKDSWNDISEKINKEKHSSYPLVADNNLDHILGIILLKDLFSPHDSDVFAIENYAREPVFVTESMSAYQVLELFKKNKLHYALVVDEFGLTKGMITMDDVMDALIGDYTELDQEEYQMYQRDDKSWLIDGQYPLVDFVKAFDIKIEENIVQKYTTVAGLLIHKMETIPGVGAVITIDNFRFEVMDKDGQRIDKLLLTVL